MNISRAFGSPLRNALAGLLPVAAFAFIGFSSMEAEAGIEACGNINLGAGASCEFKTSGGCTAACEPASFELACAGRGALECRGQCGLDATVECTSSCQGSCEAQCDVDPGAFDCTAACETDCSASCDADCSAKCSADANSAECEAQCSAGCEASCSTECEAECEVVPPSADCQAQCQGCCGGSCNAEVNFDCQIDCQADLQVSCEAELQGGCEVACEKPQGALFCDGQYVAFDDLNACLAALAAELNIEVSGSASCDNGRCEAEGSISCGASTVDPDGSMGGLMALFFGLGVVGTARRRRED
jgi:hypothetical protein